jgi:hypothetical protein
LAIIAIIAHSKKPIIFIELRISIILQYYCDSQILLQYLFPRVWINNKNNISENL